MTTTITWDIGVEGPITPSDPLPPMPPIPTGAVVLLTGRAPIWRYGMAFHAIHGRAAAVVCHDPRIGGVVVASHIQHLREGEIIPIPEK